MQFMKNPNQPTSLVEVKQQLNAIVGDKETLAQLVETTFKGLTVDVAKKAMLEALMRGFTFDDFLKKNVYAVPFKGNYSLVTSIDHARKIGMRSGVVGVAAPEYTFDENGKPVTCAVTVKKITKLPDGVQYNGEYTALVYFSEYTTGQNLWASKPLTMIAKVAEMHALRKACPEELSQAYDESEVIREAAVVTPAQQFTNQLSEADEAAISDWRDQLADAGDLEALQAVWANVPAQFKSHLKDDLATYTKTFEDVKDEGNAEAADDTTSKTKAKK